VEGKLAGCAWLDDGRLITPRQIAEALEASPYAPLPARYRVRARGNDVAVEAVVRDRGDTAGRRDLLSRLLDARVPIGELLLVDNPSGLSRPVALRGDLREPTYQQLASPFAEVPLG